jgi:hypothetical protein
MEISKPKLAEILPKGIYKREEEREREEGEEEEREEGERREGEGGEKR